MTMAGGRNVRIPTVTRHYSTGTSVQQLMLATTSILRQSARFLLAVKTSSATVERLFSSAGIILSKLRRCMKPDKLAALLYIKFAVKYNGLYLRLKEQVGDENADIRVDKFDLDSSDDD